ncbi:hypothetical protein IQ07DRAFT_236611 [Pyrenochaeta sp. DS3sAY3a]|nr:hypothetical protein IQ07DRAFT_236611 [Pyrenochaeta sp. DS3sAY3a]
MGLKEPDETCPAQHAPPVFQPAIIHQRSRCCGRMPQAHHVEIDTALSFAFRRIMGCRSAGPGVVGQAHVARHLPEHSFGALVVQTLVNGHAHSYAAYSVVMYYIIRATCVRSPELSVCVVARDDGSLTLDRCTSNGKHVKRHGRVSSFCW